MQGIIGPDLKSRYEHVLKGFLNTPADRKPEMRRIYTLIMMMLLSGCILEKQRFYAADITLREMISVSLYRKPTQHRVAGSVWSASLLNNGWIVKRMSSGAGPLYHRSPLRRLHPANVSHTRSRHLRAMRYTPWQSVPWILRMQIPNVSGSAVSR